MNENMNRGWFPSSPATRPMTRPVARPPTLEILPPEWWHRSDDRMLPIDEAITMVSELADASRSRNWSLGFFRFVFELGHGTDKGVILLEQRDREDARSVGGAFRLSLNYWSLSQVCQILETPIDFIRKLSTELAVENLNFMLMKRAKSVAIYYTNQDIHGIPRNTIRCFASSRYSRLLDKHLLEWARDTRYVTSKVSTSDKGVSVSLFGSYVDAPDGLPMRMTLILENSEVKASSVKVQACLSRSGFRIPITMAKARLKHIGNNIKLKAVRVLEDSRERFDNIDRQDLRFRLEEASMTQEWDRNDWYVFLKRKNIGKQLADKILPKGDECRTSKWELAVTLAKRAMKIPYFDARLTAELQAAKILGL